MRELTVTVIGDINLDLISLPLKAYPKKDRQEVLPGIISQLGGSSAIFASACSRLGIRTKFIGLLGFDFISDFLVDELKALGVEPAIKRIDGVEAGITISLNFKDGKRAMITSRGSNEKLSRKDFNLKDIEGEVLHVGGFNLLDNLRRDVYEIFSHAKEKGMKTSLDPNWDPKGWTKERKRDLIELLSLTDFFFPDYEEGRAITKLKEPKKIILKLMSYHNGTVALKLGEKGSLVGKGSKIFSARAFNVKTIQTTGAGDVFDAAFIKSYFSGLSLRECANFANAASALYISRHPTKRFPEEKEIVEFLEMKNLNVGQKSIDFDLRTNTKEKPHDRK